ncbi:MAG: hypothetical protein VX583_02605, partial [Bdellovibrionota bacterium]
MTSRNLLTKKVLITSLSIFSFATVANALEPRNNLLQNHQSRYSHTEKNSLDFVRISSSDKKVEICMTQRMALSDKRELVKIKKLKN